MDFLHGCKSENVNPSKVYLVSGTEFSHGPTVDYRMHGFEIIEAAKNDGIYENDGFCFDIDSWVEYDEHELVVEWAAEITKEYNHDDYEDYDNDDDIEYGLYLETRDF